MELLTLLFKLVLLATPSVDALLLDMETRDAFEGRWSSAIVTVVYRPPASPLEDPSMTPPLEVTGFVLAGPEGAGMSVVAPARRLDGLTNVQVRYASGETVSATVRWPGDERDVPLVYITPANVPEGVRSLRWAEEERIVVGRRAWVIERPKGQGPTGRPMDPVLVDTSIGPPVEPPLERFSSARLREADGSPLLDVDGRVLCALFRASPVNPEIAYCASGKWAFEQPERPSE